MAYDSPIMPAMPHLRLISRLLTPLNEEYFVYEEVTQLSCQSGPTREERLRQARQERLQARQVRLEARRTSLEVAFAAS